MIIKKIRIKNYKSISDIEFKVEKYGTSFTTFLLGINEVGKSNILKAMSFFKPTNETYDFYDLQNQKEEDGKYIDFSYDLEFENQQIYLKELKKKTIKGELLDITLFDIVKNVFLSKKKGQFEFGYEYDIEINNSVFIKQVGDKVELNDSNDIEESFELLTKDNFYNYDELLQIIDNTIQINEPEVSFWKPSEEYLITSNIDLNVFKADPYSNIPLKNIFALAGYKTNIKIKEKINEISNNNQRSRLQSILSSKTTEYITKIWKHKISFVIEISETGNLTIFVKDDGKRNEHDRHSMTVRSEGFKQFVSLILSISVDTKALDQKNRLILIDEPENHLHPSGIRDLSKELIEIGKENYLFVSTHSPFLVDQNRKERHLIIKKDSFSNTIKKEIRAEEDLKDDEVLSQAFGINVYKDLLNPKRLLVEGYSDKLILSKAFLMHNKDYGITNGTGSNVVTVASFFNDDDISIFVIVDDDEVGRKYKDNILKINGVYNNDNVFTIKDLVFDIVMYGTIEDCLGKEFIQSKFNAQFYKTFEKESDLDLLEEKAFLEQIKIYLQRNAIPKKELDIFLDELKIDISDNIVINKNFDKKFPLLYKLVTKIGEKI